MVLAWYWRGVSLVCGSYQVGLALGFGLTSGIFGPPLLLRRLAYCCCHHRLSSRRRPCGCHLPSAGQGMRPRVTTALQPVAGERVAPQTRQGGPNQPLQLYRLSCRSSCCSSGLVACAIRHPLQLPPALRGPTQPLAPLGEARGAAHQPNASAFLREELLARIRLHQHGCQ